MGGMFSSEFVKMDANKIGEVVQFLEMLRNCPQAQAYNLLYKTASMDYREAELYKTGYWHGFDKGLEEAIRIINEKVEPYE